MKLVTCALLVGLALPALAIPPVPRPAKDFTVVEPSGKQTKISSLKGKVVMIEFLFTTCPHCQNTSRVFTKLQKELGSKGLAVLGVAFNDTNPQNTANFVQQFEVGYPVGTATQDAVLGILGISVMERWAVPQVMIIDRKGMVRAQSEVGTSPQLSDETYLRKFLGDLLKEGATSTTGAKKAPVTASAVK